MFSLLPLFGSNSTVITPQGNPNVLLPSVSAPAYNKYRDSTPQSDDKYSQGLPSENMFYPNYLQKEMELLLIDCGSQPPKWPPTVLTSYIHALR